MLRETTLPLGHPLLAKPSISLDDLADEPFISLSPDSSLARILSHYFAEKNYTPNTTTYIDNPDIMRKLLNAHIGLAFIPARTWHGFSSSDIILRKVDALPMKRFLLLHWNPDAFLTPSVLLCRDVIIRYFDAKRFESPD